MIKDEKLTLSRLDEEISEAVPLVVEHVLQVHEIRDAYEKDKKAIKETKKKRKHTLTHRLHASGQQLIG